MSINRQTLKFYWHEIRKHKTSFWAMLVCVPLAGLLLDTLLPYFLTQAVGTFTSNNTELMWQLLTVAAVVALVGVGLNFLGFQSLVHHQVRVRSDLTQTALRDILAKDNAFFSSQKIGALTGKFIDFINAHEGLQDLVVIRTLIFSLNMVVGITLIFMHSWVLGWIVLGLIIGLLIGIRVSLRLRQPLRQARKDMVGTINGAIADTISNNLTVKTFAQETFELRQITQLTDIYQRLFQRDFRWTSSEASLRLLVMSSVQIIAIAIIATMLTQGQIELGIAIFIIAYLQRIAAQLFTLGELVNGYDKLFLQAAPMTEILLTRPTITDAPNASTLRVTKGDIELRRVSYAYSDAPETDVITDLSLHIPAGQRVGVVGTSGAGKTTLTKLLLRFDDIKEGELLIDEQNIQYVTQASLRQALAYVPQEPLLFHRTLRENIAYSKPEATDTEVRQAAKAANALEFIERLPHGLDTVVGERGIKLSGGQRQRVAIARAILKDAPILVLDEATSALDSESEKLIQASLEGLMKNRTSIVIAHRLSTIAKLDRIIVLEDGHIVEDGSHDALLQQHGIYAKLWNHQSGGFITTD
ncbi:ABC transporter ATP-binding protein [Candidatus Saccharibacteria bacterium]|nr:ABC transporter ATP-binding protein [Candidatus Saccharibacteria bacterium]